MKAEIIVNVTRADRKRPLVGWKRERRVYSWDVDRMTGLRCEQTITLIGTKTADAYPQHLRRVVFSDEDNDRRLAFLLNQL